jgi:hypothetical protein
MSKYRLIKIETDKSATTYFYEPIDKPVRKNWLTKIKSFLTKFLTKNQ